VRRIGTHDMTNSLDVFGKIQKNRRPMPVIMTG
jgi:hypothetical protein